MMSIAALEGEKEPQITTYKTMPISTLKTKCNVPLGLFELLQVNHSNGLILVKKISV